MKKNFLTAYDSPQLRVCAIRTETGFAASGEGSDSSLEDMGDETIDVWQ